MADLFLVLYLVGFIICAGTVRRRPVEIALLWPVVILILFTAVAIAAVDLSLERLANGAFPDGKKDEP